MLPKEDSHSIAVADVDKELLFDVFDVAVNGIIVVDKAHRVVLWNTWMEESTSIHRCNAIDKTLIDLFPEVERQRLHQTITNALEHGASAVLSHAFNTHPLPLYHKLKRDDPIKQVIFVKPISDSNNARYCVIQINDVSAAHRREKTLREIAEQADLGRKAAEEFSKLKSGFISTVSHELRTPLTSIRGSLGLLKANVPGSLPTAAESLVQIADKNTERLLLLINDILDIEKIESGRMDYAFKDLEIQELIEQAVEVNAGYGEHKGVTLHIKACAENIRIYADLDRLMQVMTNLLSNAIKFEPSGGSVDITATCSERHIRVAVSDHGPGIPEEFQRRVFEKFAQADVSDNKNINGTGLGLAISRSIVEKHGGEIGFVTDAARGTTFYFILPLSERE